MDSSPIDMPPPPECAFASDNAAGAHPAVIEAVQRANHGHALAYGDDDHTRECERRFGELFGRDVATFLTFNGTGGNVMALTALARPGDAVVCTDWAHINVDETGAPERVVGAKLIDVPAVDGKLTTDAIERQVHAIGVPHHAQPAIVSITESTELGTVYRPDEVAAICEVAHRHGMRVHMDGARIANAVAACGGSVAALRALTVDAGVDVITFGGTKNGMLGGEAVVFLDPALATRGQFVRKTVTQLPSKMRFVAAQFNALIDGDLWITLAQHANAMAAALYAATSDVAGVEHAAPPQVNSVFPTLPPDVIDPLRSWCFFWDWDTSRHQVRWMTAWDTTADDVARFSAGVRAILAPHN
jgi:threonine aldolase